MNWNRTTSGTGGDTQGSGVVSTDVISNFNQIFELIRQEDIIASSNWASRNLTYLLSESYQTSAVSLQIGYSPRFVLNEAELERLDQIRKNQEAIKLLDSWLTSSSKYDQEAWPSIKKAIEENRLSDRKRFDGSETDS